MRWEGKGGVGNVSIGFVRCGRATMTVHFLLMVNKQGQTRLAKYCKHGLTTEQKRALEGEIVRKCIRRADKKVGSRGRNSGRTCDVVLQEWLTARNEQCSFVEHLQYKVVYRRYASLFFMVGVDQDEVRACR